MFARADALAREAEQGLSTGHALIALFAVRNVAVEFLKSRCIEPMLLLDQVEVIAPEPPALMEEVLTRATQCAVESGHAEVNCLHVLTALTLTPRSDAAVWLGRAGVDLNALRSECKSALANGLPRFAATRNQEHETRDTLEMAAVAAETESVTASRFTTSSFSAAAPRRPDVTPGNARGEDRRQRSGRRATDQSPPKSVEAPGRGLGAQEREAILTSRGARAADTAVAGPYILNVERFPVLSALGRNLSHAAWSGELDPVFGRDAEIEACIDIIHKRRSNNPCLLGEPGVGKTAIAEGIAARFVSDDAARETKPTRVVVQVDVGAILSGTHLRGALAERLRGLQAEVRDANGAVIVFIDELHTLIGAGAGDGAHDAANELKSALARGQFPCIGATTPAEFRAHIEQDPALERRFSPVFVDEPDVPTTLQIVGGVIDRYATHHGVQYEPDAIDAAVRLGRRYLHERRDPDRALALLDLAGSVARRGGERVSRRIVAQVISRDARVPLDHLLVDDPQRFLQVEARLAERIVGQPRALEAIGTTIRRNLAGFSGQRPIGSFLFLGPTGVGKTETVKAAAEFLFGHSNALLRFDMSEFLEAHAVSRLIGAPPGYVGHADGGQLTEAIRKRPYQIVLFDEVEKSHREVWNILLQILDDGRLTDGHGRVVDFTNTVFVLKSNLGAEVFGAEDDWRIGFAGAADAPSTLDERVLQRARTAMPPELWNRIETRVVFRPLGRDDVRKVARLMLSERAARLESERGITLAVDDAAVDWLLDHGGFDGRLGARPMRQTISRAVESPLAERLLAQTFVRGDTVRVTPAEERLNFEKV